MRWLWTIGKLGGLKGAFVWIVGSTMLYILLRELETSGTLSRFVDTAQSIGTNPMSDPLIRHAINTWTRGCHLLGVALGRSSTLTMSIIVILFGLDVLPAAARGTRSLLMRKPPNL